MGYVEGYDKPKITFSCESKSKILGCELSAYRGSCNRYASPSNPLQDTCKYRGIETIIKGTVNENQCIFIAEANKFSKLDYILWYYFRI